jgi:hypothetical protein
VADSGRWIACIGRAGVPVVDGGCGADRALAEGIAQFDAIAGVAIAARGLLRNVDVLDDTGGAGISRARVSVVDHQRRTAQAGTRSVALLVAVAGVAVGAAHSERQGGVHDPERAIARVSSTGIVIVDGKR